MIGSISKKTGIIILSIVALLLIGRIILPYVLLKYTNKALDDMEGYHGGVEDLDVALLRGGFTIHNLIIEKDSTNIPVPFLEVKKLDLSIHWKALFNGALVGEIVADEPVFNFAIDSTGQEVQTGSENNWVKTLKEITPVDVNLNLVTINNAQVYYKDFSQSPTVDIYIKSLYLNAKNLSNVVDKTKRLPANIEAKGISVGEGNFIFNAKTNILKPIPDFNFDLKIEEANLVSLNSFAEGYANFDFEEGKFSLYSEMVMDNGSYKGYIKPVLNGVNIIKRGSDKNKTILNKGYQHLLDGLAVVFENKRNGNLATKSPISGDVNKTDVDILKTLGSAFKNAFIKALPKKIDKEL